VIAATSIVWDPFVSFAPRSAFSFCILLCARFKRKTTSSSTFIVRSTCLVNLALDAFADFLCRGRAAIYARRSELPGGKRFAAAPIAGQWQWHERKKGRRKVEE